VFPELIDQVSEDLLLLLIEYVLLIVSTLENIQEFFRLDHAVLYVLVAVLLVLEGLGLLVHLYLLVEVIVVE
jgi:hypothetical protein